MIVMIPIFNLARALIWKIHQWKSLMRCHTAGMLKIRRVVPVMTPRKCEQSSCNGLNKQIDGRGVHSSEVHLSSCHTAVYVPELLLELAVKMASNSLGHPVLRVRGEQHLPGFLDGG